PNPGVGRELRRHRPREFRIQRLDAHATGLGHRPRGAAGHRRPGNRPAGELGKRVRPPPALPAPGGPKAVSRSSPALPLSDHLRRPSLPRPTMRYGVAGAAPRTRRVETSGARSDSDADEHTLLTT